MCVLVKNTHNLVLTLSRSCLSCISAGFPCDLQLLFLLLLNRWPPCASCIKTPADLAQVPFHLFSLRLFLQMVILPSILLLTCLRHSLPSSFRVQVALSSFSSLFSSHCPFTGDHHSPCPSTSRGRSQRRCCQIHRRCRRRKRSFGQHRQRRRSLRLPVHRRQGNDFHAQA